MRGTSHYRKESPLSESAHSVKKSSRSAKTPSFPQVLWLLLWLLLLLFLLLLVFFFYCFILDKTCCCSGIQVSCPYLYCTSKNSQFQHAGRFPSGDLLRNIRETFLYAFFSEFVLNHLHSSHKHRRFNGDSLDMTMVVPQVEVENGPIRHDFAQLQL